MAFIKSVDVYLPKMKMWAKAEMRMNKANNPFITCQTSYLKRSFFCHIDVITSKINRKAVLRLMRKLNILSVARKKNHYRQIQKLYGAINTYPNVLR